MKAPVEPNKEDCCNNGCNPCIFDIYEKQLQLYEKQQQNESAQILTENGILQLEYTLFIVKDELLLCDSHKMITFQRQSPSHNVWWKPGDHFVVLYKSNDKKISKAYTPIKLKQQSLDELSFTVIVKKYPGGLVSNYLFDLCKGDSTLWRGPYSSYELIANKFENIVLIAQGTGIATLISIIDSILCNEDDLTKISLHYCCQSNNTILFRQELYNFKAYWNFKYNIYLSKPLKCMDIKYQEPVNNRRLRTEDIEISKNQYLLCGSNDFMVYFKEHLLSQGVALEDIILF